MSWLENLERDQGLGKKRLAALLDPDDLPSGREWFRFLDRLQQSTVTDVFIGGSLLIKHNVADIIQTVREGSMDPSPFSRDPRIRWLKGLMHCFFYL
jgi:hypothetical protein